MRVCSSATDGEREALVRHLLGRDVLEEVRLLQLSIEGDEVDGAQRVEVLDDLGQLTELRIGAGQGRRLEDPPHDDATFTRPARRLGQLSIARGRGSAGSPAARGLAWRRVPQVDPAPGDEGDELLGVERVAVGPLVDERHQSSLISAGVSAPSTCASLDRTSAAASSASSRSSGDLREVGRCARSRARRRGRLRSIGEHEQHRQRGRRPTEDLEQVARQRVDPVAVLEHEDDRLLGPRGPAGRSATRSSSEALRIFASNEPVISVVGDRRARGRTTAAAPARRGRGRWPPGSHSTSARARRRPRSPRAQAPVPISRQTK